MFGDREFVRSLMFFACERWRGGRRCRSRRRGIYIQRYLSLPGMTQLSPQEMNIEESLHTSKVRT